MERMDERARGVWDCIVDRECSVVACMGNESQWL